MHYIALAMRCLPYLSFIFISFYSQPQETDNSLLSNPEQRQASWHSKLRSFVSVRRDIETIEMPQAPELGNELFTIDSAPLDLAFAAGGNLLPRTSIYGELVLSSNEYRYQQENPAVTVNTDEIRGDLLVEYDLGSGLTSGIDVFFSDRSDKYDIQMKLPDGIFTEQYSDDFKVYGSDLMLSKSYFMDDANIRAGYSFSLWKSEQNQGTVTRKYHNASASYYKQWSTQVSSSFSYQRVYFPGDYFVLSETIKHVNFYAAEFRYRFIESSEVTLGFERLTFGERSNIQSLSIRLEYQFGVNKTKRRKRQYKIPTPLFRIRGLLN